MVHFQDYALTKKGKTKVVRLIKSLRQTNIISKPPGEQVYLNSQDDYPSMTCCLINC